MIERNIDYIQFSALFSEKKIIEKQFDSIPPTKFYKRGYRDQFGTRYYFGNSNPKVKSALVVMAGAALDAMRDAERHDYETLQWIYEVGGKVTRLDLAVTEWVETNLITVQDVEKWYRKGLIVSNLTKYGARTIIGYPSENSPRQIETFYIGDMERRGTNGIFRAYDKGIELDLGKYLGTRLELELRGESANGTAKRIAASGDLAGNFRSKFDVKHKDFRRVMEADAVIVKRGKAQKNKDKNDELSKRWDWLINQVAPALNSAIADDKKAGFGDARLTQFLIASGLAGEMSDAVKIVADMKYKEKLRTNGLT